VKIQANAQTSARDSLALRTDVDGREADAGAEADAPSPELSANVFAVWRVVGRGEIDHEDEILTASRP